MEHWKDIPGYEGLYKISSEGRVLSFRGKSPRFLKPGRSGPYGHLTVALGRKASKSVHRLVLLSFAGPAPARDQEVRHLNGVAGDNRLANLRWGTRSENNFDTSAHGKRKLTIGQVRIIKNSSETTRTLANKFGVSYSTVYAARSGQNWAYVE